MMTDDEIIAVVKGHKEGKFIQVRPINNDRQWFVAVPEWNFSRYVYRVKPEPLQGVAVKMVEADDQQ